MLRRAARASQKEVAVRKTCRAILKPASRSTVSRFVRAALSCAPVPFVPTATPGGAPVSEALAPEDAIQVENATLQLVPPNGCELVENLAEPNRLGSARAYDYKLGFGFGCPSPDGNLRMQEAQLQTAASLAAYDSQCASGGCDANRVTSADFEAHRTALQDGQAAAGWALLDVSGRSVMARSVPMSGAPAVMRQYTEFCGDVRVENWVVMLGEDASSLEATADSFFGSLAVSTHRPPHRVCPAAQPSLAEAVPPSELPPPNELLPPPGEPAPPGASLGNTGSVDVPHPADVPTAAAASQTTRKQRRSGMLAIEALLMMPPAGLAARAPSQLAAFLERFLCCLQQRYNAHAGHERRKADDCGAQHRDQPTGPRTAPPAQRGLSTGAAGAPGDGAAGRTERCRQAVILR